MEGHRPRVDDRGAAIDRDPRTVHVGRIRSDEPQHCPGNLGGFRWAPLRHQRGDRRIGTLRVESDGCTEPLHLGVGHLGAHPAGVHAVRPNTVPRFVDGDGLDEHAERSLGDRIGRRGRRCPQPGNRADADE